MLQLTRHPSTVSRQGDVRDRKWQGRARRSYQRASRCHSTSCCSRMSATRFGVISSSGPAALRHRIMGNPVSASNVSGDTRSALRCSSDCESPLRRRSATVSFSLRPSCIARSFSCFTKSSGNSIVVFICPSYWFAGFLSSWRTRSSRIDRDSRGQGNGLDDSTRCLQSSICHSRNQYSTPAPGTTGPPPH